MSIHSQKNQPKIKHRIKNKKQPPPSQEGRTEIIAVTLQKEMELHLKFCQCGLSFSLFSKKEGRVGEGEVARTEKTHGTVATWRKTRLGQGGFTLDITKNFFSERVIRPISFPQRRLMPCVCPELRGIWMMLLTIWFDFGSVPKQSDSWT